MNMQVRKVADVPTNLHTDTFLTDFSLRYRQDVSGFVSPVAATQIPVMKETGKFRTFPRGYFWRDEAEVRPRGGRPVQVGYKTGEEFYGCEQWGLESTIDDQDRANAVNEFDLDQAAVELLDGKMMIREDRIWAQKTFATGVWAYDYTGAGGTPDFDQFDDLASDPVKTIGRFKLNLGKGSGFKANTVVFGANAAEAFKNNASVVDRVKYTATGIITDQLIASLLGVANVRIAESIYNASAEKNTADGGEDFQYIVDPDSVWIGHVAPRGALNTPTAIARFGWAGLPGANQLGGIIRRGRDDRASSDWIQNLNAFDIKVVAPDLGILLTAAVAPTP